MKMWTEEELAIIAAKYDSVADFRKKDSPAYRAAYKRGLLDKLCAGMKRGWRQYTEDEIIGITSRYTVLDEFRKNEPRLYKALANRKAIKKYCSHMKLTDHGAYPEEVLVVTALKYTTFKEFREKDMNIYNVIVKRGLKDKLCSHIKPLNVYTEEELKETAEKYTDLTEFRNKEHKIYESIKRRGLIKELCGHMKRNWRGEWTSEELEEIASRYDTLKDLRTKDHDAYQAIRKRGLLKDLCGRMERRIDRYTDEQLAEIARRYKDINTFAKEQPSVYHIIKRRGLFENLCGQMERKGNIYKRKIYVFTFSDGYAYVGLAKDPNGRYEEHTKYDDRSPVYKHIRETGIIPGFDVLTDFLDKDAAARVEDEYINRYAADGWKMLNTARGGALGSVSQFYTDKFIRDDVTKYEYLDDFKIESPNTYIYLKRHKLFDKYCSNLKRRKKIPIQWTLELAIEKAEECKTPSELYRKYYQASVLLKKAGLYYKFYPKRR